MHFQRSFAPALLVLSCCLRMGGCCSCSSSIEPSPQDQILEANRRIERSRAFQRFAVFAAPLERKVEGLIKRDECIETARFALEAYLYDVATFYDFFDRHAPAGMYFDLVIATKAATSEDEISRSVITALRDSGFRAHAPLKFDHHDNQWAITFGTVWVQSPDPVDVAALELIILEDERKEIGSSTQPGAR